MSSDVSAASESPRPIKKARNPIERLVVWGGIGVMLVILGIEARASLGYSKSLLALQDVLKDSEKAHLTLPEARTRMVLAPSETVGTKNGRGVAHRFSWYSLFKPGQYEINLIVSADKDEEVTDMTTPAAPADAMNAPVPPPAPTPPVGAMSMQGSVGLAGMPMVGGEAGGGMGGGGGGRRREPPRNLAREALDADKNGEITAEEIAKAPEVLITLDKNGDGQLTEDEVFERPAPESGAGGPEGGASGDNRPLRPAAEE